MKYAIIVSACSLLALAACSESNSPAPEASASAAPEAAAPSAAPAADGQAPTEEFVVGTWGEAPGCKMPITFAAGGKITNGPFDTWELKDGLLTMGGAISMKLTVIDAKTMHSTNDGGGEATLMRCDAPAKA